MMLINLFYFSKTENELRLLLSALISFFLAFLITEFLNTDENAAIEKCTVNTLRKMREELKAK